MGLYFINTLLLSLSCICCLTLRSELELGAVTAAALTGLLGSFLQLPGHIIDRDQLHAVVYTGAFVGMGTPAVLSGPADAVGISLLGAGIFLLFRPLGVGVGGKMGTIAFISSLIFIVFRRTL